MTEIANDIDPILKSVVIDKSPDAVFRFFVDHMSEWWPLEESCDATDNKPLARIVFPREIGQEIRGEYADGTGFVIGRLRHFEEPRRILFTWHWGWEPTEATEVEVSFTAEGSATRLDLVHRGWEKLGARGPKERRDHEGGWDLIIGELFRAWCAAKK
ncbi:SRPBCC domain-containing protein [Paremcibacter congregatus]|uniref:Activator of Hsp90 ATPase homologue 1/2-like C-terminal domain-containing protein n=1 Tax=Paremcibacter congregatus TaxID=2043170 RepID=A0A2G4YVS3_9PROT|nr:SRPBCC domain-containing protein [Paremcibacter congregatus]PHZ86442.1 hypothetical protein CRD36_00715 [Paremcibacter congregatus]QDE28461.1 hypothetical protein FIV45_14880 [Paremcibacter congregatus]